ncbi:hypothetical protein LGM43_13890 [Burkholderia seminalis]|uniref:DUF2357 domain-containing protein n=1 Tax=Burkholderia seminalis TaxID=488731 RepID=UPI001CF11362|nr:nuclease domain-containing protein [Burkholderia seminalis]MCA7951360.1 hypothetical protein [Burkholderia seminalis]
MLIDDTPLERQPAHNTFLWCPGFYAGRVVAEVLDDPGQVHGTYSLDVGPSPDKVGHPQFLRMVDEILAFKPELLLGSGASWSSFGKEDDTTSPEVIYARLRRYGPIVLAALQAVCFRPLSHLRRDRLAVMPHQARRLDTTTVRELARSRFVGQILGLEVVSTDAPSRINVPRSEHTFDNAANRAIAVMVGRLASQATALSRRFAGAINSADDSLTAKIPRRLHILREFVDALRQLQSSPALSAVTRPEITAAGLNAISAQPNYARAFQLAWKALQSGIRGDAYSDPLPISPTWEVFERWCFLRVWKLLEAILPVASWGVDSNDSGTTGLRVRGKVADTAIAIHLQPTFPAWDQPSRSGFKSLSRLREPDLVLTFESPRGRRFLVLDAKYRASRPNVLDAMQSAHIYRDSLRWRGERPCGSYLLLPRQGGTPWLAESAFHAEFEVGTFELEPDGDASQLKKLLTGFLTLA